MFGYIILISVFVGSVHGSCSTLTTDITTCYTNSGLTFSTSSSVDTFSTYLNDCSKVTELATCVGNALSSCDTIRSAVPDVVAIKAAYNGLCANKAVFQAGLTCMSTSGVNELALVTSCVNTTLLTSLFVEIAANNWQSYCSYQVTVVDCYMNGYSCSSEFETMYKDFTLALLPSACRSYSSSLSPWISTYGTASKQKYSTTLMAFAIAGGMMIWNLF